jgi:plastocyanin
MRSPRLLLIAPLTAIAALFAAPSGLAAGVGIGVKDFEFTPGSQKVAVGDTITWTFNDGGHTTTSLPGQAEKWDSKLEDKGGKYTKTFSKPGKYQYVCTPHESFMKGTITVGSDTVKKTAGAVTAKVSGKTVTLSFKLNEGAKTGVRLSGAAKRSVKAKYLKAGKHSIVVKKLKSGSYKATLSFQDDFDNKASAKKSFKVG